MASSLPTETPPPSYSATATSASTPDTVPYNSPDDIKASPAETTNPLITNGPPRPPLIPVDDGGFPEVVASTSSSATAKEMGGYSGDNKPSVSVGNRHSVPLQGAVSPISPSGVHDDLVTPLNLLGDQADWVDCPFCRRRVETKVKLDASMMTHAAATGLFLTTLGGVVAPYAKKWKCHVTHICTNCNRKVAYQPYGKEMRALGTPEHLRQVSKFQAASPGGSSRTSTHQ